MSLNVALSKGKKLFQKFYNIPDGKDPKTRRNYLTDALKNYDGFNSATESEALARLTQHNIDYYYADPCFNGETPNYKLVEQIIVDTYYPTISILRIPTKEGMFHCMEITDPEAITGIKICPYCKVHCMRVNQKHYDRFQKHMEECKERGGKLVREVDLKRTQKPYAPHIQKQPIYAFY